MILLCAVPVLAITILALRYYSHMLQLSSYQFQGYFRVLRSEKLKMILHAFVLVLPVLAIVGLDLNVMPGLVVLGILLIAVLVCSAGLIHQHSLNYSLLNREIRKHSKT